MTFIHVAPDWDYNCDLQNIITKKKQQTRELKQESYKVVS